jgi:hypothetical protein
MKKPSLSDALAQKTPATPVESPAPKAEATESQAERRVVTSLRISPEDLEALKIIAAKRRGKVNDLILEGVAHVLALYGMKA